MASNSEPVLGTVVVVGGCGFLGFHIVRALSQDPACTSVVVLSRQPTKNLQDGVKHYSCDITDLDKTRTLLNEIQPRAIMHTASPMAIDPTAKAHHFHSTNVRGTENLLTCAAEIPSIKAFVFTSTVNVVAGSPHVNVSEQQPLWEPTSKTIPYWLSKAAADKLVRASTSEQLATVTLRLPVIYGERDNQFIPAQLAAYRNKQTGVQLGDNKNLTDQVYAGNAATAHVLAAKALLNPTLARGPVAGEAFNITDGAPIFFWDFCRIVWRAAGDTTELKDVKVIPAWLALQMANVTEGLYWITTFGSKRPKTLNRLTVEFCLRTYTYDISKARRVLGYEPEVNREAVIKKAIEWETAKEGRVGGG